MSDTDVLHHDPVKLAKSIMRIVYDMKIGGR